MNKIAKFVVLLSCLSLIVCFQTLLADEAAEKAAQAAAEKWLGLVDQGQYAESWGTAASYFKNAVPEKQWVQSMKGARQPLGKMISRDSHKGDKDCSYVRRLMIKIPPMFTTLFFSCFIQQQ